MAGCSLPAEAPFPDVVGILRKLQSLGFCLDLDISSKGPGELSSEELRSLFNRILSLFLKEIHLWREIRPLPAMLGNGRSVDLFKLYLVVCRKGGFDSVSASRSWASVADEIGLDSAVGSSLKLIYVKYLDALDRWLCRVLEEKAVGDRAGDRKDLGSLVVELETEVNGRFCGTLSQKKDCESTPPSGSKRDQFLTPVRRNGCKLQLADDESGKDDVAVIMELDAADGEFSLKRKREDLVGMLNWVKRVAKNPNDPSIGKFSDGAKYQDHAIGELFSQAILARQAMFIKRIRTNTDVSLIQKGQKTQPSTYADCLGASTQTNEKTKCSESLQSANKQTDLGSSLETPSLAEYDMDTGLAEGGEGNHGKRRLSRDKLHIRIPLGPSFQAKVPDWTGKPSETSCDSDNLKWLGTQIWPPENQDNKPLSEQDSIGKGRQETCQCKHPLSVECVRFHVAEKRFQLIRELGSAFDSWRFNLMGEEVALSWTEEEQRTFKAIVRLNPSSNQKNFWDKLRLCFPLKGTKILVSYYFNVFLLSRRCYQNRVTPNRIDSDDDETEFDFLSSPYGHDAVNICDSKHNFCIQNAQCVDLEECVNGD